MQAPEPQPIRLGGSPPAAHIPPVDRPVDLVDQTIDPVEPTAHNMAYGALSAALADHDVHLAPEIRSQIRDELLDALAPFLRKLRQLADQVLVAPATIAQDAPAGPDAGTAPAESAGALSMASRSTRFSSAAAGRPLDLVSFTAGSGRHYEGERSSFCPGDRPGHRHDVRCIRPTWAVDADRA